jgi:uncharacterized repeat protein (TIGR03803 family)
MNKLNWMAKAYGVFLLWATAAVALPAQTFTTLLNFNGTDGEAPTAALVQGIDGNFYGTATTGGANVNCDGIGCGTVFKITPSGALTTLYSFCSLSNCMDGEYPQGALVQGTDGDLYGVTQLGGVNVGCDIYGEAEACGTVFKITPGGTLTTLHSFDYTDGLQPSAGLLQGADGQFYGTTLYGGSDGNGTVFSITPDGTLTTLHSFEFADGDHPAAVLIQATNGNFYGTTANGGANPCLDYYGCGTVFKMTPTGTLTTLYSFDLGAGGYLPFAGLAQGADGNYYGTTYYGGDTSSGCGGEYYGCGTVFKITPSGTLTTLYSFDGTDGAYAYAGLVQGTDGNFYGTTSSGGADDDGTIFKLTPSGTLTTLHSFDETDGQLILAGLIQGTNGTLYGTTQNGGADSSCNDGYGCGTIFSVSVGLGPFVETQPASGKVGSIVKILGTDLTGATSVTFNGTAATYTVVSSSEISTTVPTGATTGTVQVVTPKRALKSNVRFTVK